MNTVQKCHGNERQEKTGNVTDFKRLRRNNNEMQCGILDRILEQKKRTLAEN